MLCISSVLNARDGGMQHMRFCGSCGDSTAVLISHASTFLFLLLIGKKINICKLRIQQLSVQYCIFVIPLYIRYLNTEMFILLLFTSFYMCEVFIILFQNSIEKQVYDCRVFVILVFQLA